MRTDFDEAEARAAAGEFETQYSLLEDVAFPTGEVPEERTTIILFRTEAELRAFAEPGVGGMFIERLPLEVERHVTVLLSDRFDGKMRFVFSHELVHRFLHRAFGDLPPWLDEGLADYYATVRADKGTAYLGEVPKMRVINPKWVPAIEDLIRADRATFYGENGGSGAWGPRERRTLNYAGAWALVHFLRNGDDAYRARFANLIRALEDGERAPAAWAKAMKDVAPEKIEEDFRAYLEADTWDLFARPVHPKPAAGVTDTRLLRDEEIHIMWSRLVLKKSGASKADALAEIDEAARHGAPPGEIAYSRALFAASEKQWAEAERYVQSALAASPGDARFLYTDALIQAQRHDMAALRQRLPKLRSVATSIDELAFVAAHESDEGAVADAETIARAAVARDPGYWRSYAALAHVLAEAHKFREAAEAQERAVYLLPEGADLLRMLATLAEYRRKATVAKE